jgi:hypothetical protein
MSSAAIAAVEKAEAARWACLTSQDYDKLETLLHDDLKYTHSNALFETKADLVGNLRSGAFLYKSITRDKLVFSAHAGAVFVNGTAVIEAAFKGAPMTVRMRFSNVWVPGPQGAWQMVLWHSVPMPA